MHTAKIGWTCLALALTLCGQSQAALITSAAGMTAPDVVNFSQFGPGFTHTAGPTEIGGLVGSSITFTSTTSSVLGKGGYGLSSNGSWSNSFAGGPANGYSGLDAPNGSMTYTFNDFLVSGVGGFINYAPFDGSPTLIEALGVGGVVLESYQLLTDAPIVTPAGQNAGAFRGIQRATADIRALRVSNSFVVLDDLTFSQAVVPEPGSLLAMFSLVSVGAGAIVIRRRKTKKLVA